MSEANAPRLSTFSTCLIAAILALIWCAWQMSSVWFFKDDFVNLFFAYDLGWASLPEPVFERGYAPGYRALYLLVISDNGPLFSRALLICSVWMGLAGALLYWIASKRNVNGLAGLLAAGIIISYPLMYSTIEWLPSAFHLLPAICACLFLARLLLQPGPKVARDYCLAALASVACALFAGPEALILAVAFLITASLSRYAPDSWVNWVIFLLLAAGLILTIWSELGEWDHAGNNIEGAGKQDLLLQLAVFFKSLARYSLPGVLGGNADYLSHSFSLTLLGYLFIGATTVWALRSDTSLRKLAIFAWTVNTLTLLAVITQRADHAGWIAIPGHRYWLLGEVLLLLCALLLVLNWANKRWQPGYVYAGLATVLLAGLIQGGSYRQTLYQHHDFLTARAAVAEAEGIASRELPARRCQQRLPSGLPVPHQKYNHKFLLVRYFTNDVCDFRPKPRG